jgi:hypothetical protein
MAGLRFVLCSTEMWAAEAEVERCRDKSKVDPSPHTARITIEEKRQPPRHSTMQTSSSFIALMRLKFTTHYSSLIAAHRPANPQLW